MNVEVEVFSAVVGLLVGRRWFPYECGGGSVLNRGRFVSGETVVSI